MNDENEMRLAVLRAVEAGEITASQAADILNGRQEPSPEQEFTRRMQSQLTPWRSIPSDL
jgi:hypothetical protein